jgi:hypothetical protein
MSPTTVAVVIGGCCAALTLIAAIARSLYRGISEAQANSKSVQQLNTDMTDVQDKVENHGVRLAVLEDRDKREDERDAEPGQSA